MTWTSWHLHPASAERPPADRLITDLVGPAVAGLPSTSWFFVRYWQGGPHVRLRVSGLPPERATALGRVLRDGFTGPGRLEESERPLDPVAFAAQSRRLSAAGEGGVPVPELGLRPPGVHLSSYVPEYERYGGASLMDVSEGLFGVSSELCLAFLRTRPSDRSRTRLALRATASAAAVLDDSRFAQDGARSWRSWARRYGYPDDVLHRLDAGCAEAAARLAAGGKDLAALAGDAAGPLSRWRNALAGAVERWRGPLGDRTARIVFSHVHMLHNRLGLDTLDELRHYSLLAAGTPAVASRVRAAHPSTEARTA